MSAAYLPLFTNDYDAAAFADTRQWTLVYARATAEQKADPMGWLEAMLRWCAGEDATGNFNYLGGTPGSLNFFFSDDDTAFRFKIRWG